MKIVIFKVDNRYAWTRIGADGKNLGTPNQSHATTEACLRHIAEFFGIDEPLPKGADVINLPPISISISWPV